MTMHTRTIRRGLPRWPGGESWPPAGDGAVEVDQQSAMPTDVAAPAPAPTLDPVTAPSDSKPTGAAEPPAPAAPVSILRPIRRGLPRAPAGQPWPPAGTAPASAAETAPAKPAEAEPAVPAVRRGLPRPGGAATAAAATAAPTSAKPSVRRGLPRPGEGGAAATAAPPPEPAEQPAAAASAATAAATAPASQPTRTPLARPATPTRPSAPARPRPATAPAKEPGRFDAVNRGELLGTALVGGFGLLLAATIAVIGASWFLSSPAGRDFLASFPGEYELPEGAAPGFPVWVQWQHFFNVFLIVLIIRSGLQVRTEKRPGAYWTPRWSKGGQGKISLALWFHQSLDILWLVNGVVFVVLLFVTGHWVRIVPTSWEVFPNAISAGVQYLALDWPTENGWVNYNSLQQIMYFVTVFVAAPLAVITGVRMSGLWPKNAKTLSRIYPVEWARAIHFPVMLYFVAFVIVHVALVFATGALRNLNHMYGGTDVVNWAGFGIFFVSLLIIVGGWVAARPFLLAQIAKLTGKVSAR